MITKKYTMHKKQRWKSSLIGFPWSFTFVSIHLDPKASNDTNKKKILWFLYKKMILIVYICSK